MAGPSIFCGRMLAPRLVDDDSRGICEHNLWTLRRLLTVVDFPTKEDELFYLVVNADVVGRTLPPLVPLLLSEFRSIAGVVVLAITVLTVNPLQSGVTVIGSAFWASHISIIAGVVTWRKESITDGWAAT